MKSPWVSREAFDMARGLADREHENAQALRHGMADLTARYEALLERYHALKLAGGVAPLPKSERVTDPLVLAINAKSAGNPELRAMMLRQLEQDRTNALLNPDDILDRIHHGTLSYLDGVPG